MLPSSVLSYCCDLALASNPIQLLVHSPSSIEESRDNRHDKPYGSRQKGKSLTSYCRGENRLNLGKINLIYS